MAGLIIAIGAQNALVLRQGLRRSHVFSVALTCALIDATLITVGVAGFGGVVGRYPQAVAVAAWAGAAFLAVYGVLSLRSAFKSESLEAGGGEPATTQTLAAVLSATLAVSLLNPHVYLDTIVLVGSVAVQYPPAARVSFALGAMAASFTWFFSLAFGARFLAPLFARPIAWRILDAAIALVMFSVAFSLVRTALGA
ncbi:MAG TPA: LysE family transporter [Coriobacteriia bacterium]|nr:LysE family transporter [Coriobacteriia bacterium]